MTTPKSSIQSGSSNYWILLIPIAILILGSILHYDRGSFGAGNSKMLAQGLDDAYITYRYGWNLAHFQILSWNESGFRRTEGFTNPLWVLASAVWSFPGNKDWVYPLSVVTSIVASACLLFILANAVYQRNNSSLAALMGLIMVTTLPPIWLHMTSGLESGVFGVSIAVLAYLVIFDDTRASSPWLILLLAIAIGTLRSDGFIYLGMVLLAALIAGSNSWKFLAAGLLASMFGLFVWRFLTFGTLVSNTATAKVNFSLVERLPVAFLFFKATMLNSGLALFLLIGLAGLKLERKRVGLAGLTLIVVWFLYYLFIGGDVYIERHLIGLFFLLAAFSAPLWRIAKPLTRGLFVLLVIMVGLISILRYGDRFDYLSPKANDPWVMLGKAVAADRDRYGVLITFAAGKIPFYAGGDCIDSIGLNDPYLATQKRESFVPGHSSGDEQVAIEIARSHPADVYSALSYMKSDFVREPEDVALWVDNLNPQETVQNYITTEQWAEAIASNDPYIWSIITNPVRLSSELP